MAARFSVWRLDPPVVGTPSLEAASGHAQQSHDNNQSSSSPSSPSSTPTPGNATGMQQWYSEPQAWQWYNTDPARHRMPPSESTPLSSSTPSPGPSNPGTAPLSAIDAILDILASLKTLHFQFRALQDSLGGVTSDVKDALSQLHAMRTAQNKTDKSIAVLESVVGVSSIGAKPKGHGKRTRGRGRGRKATEAQLEVDDTDIGTVPNKTLVQSVAAIQSSVEALLARDNLLSHSHLPMGHMEEPIRRWISSVIDPSRQRPTLPFMKFTFPVSSTSQSESSSLSSIAVPESGTSSPLVTTAKEYIDASIQACPPSPASYPSLRPTAFATEHMARFLCDTHLPSVPGAAMGSSESQVSKNTQLPTCLTYTPASSSYTIDRNSGPQRADSIDTPAVANSSDMSTIPSAGGTTPVAVGPHLAGTSTQSSERLQAPSLTIANSDYSTTSPQMRSPGDLQTPPDDALGSLGSTRDTPTSTSGTSGHGDRAGYLGFELDAGDVQMTSEAESDAMTVTDGAKATRLSPGGEADGGGLSPGLPTRRSETATEDHGIQMVSRSTREQGSATHPKYNLMLRTQLSGNLSIIPTPPSWTPEPSMGEDRGMLSTGGQFTRQASLEAVSGLSFPLTPSLFSSSSAAGELLGEGGDGDMEQQIGGRGVAAAHAESMDDAGTTVIEASTSAAPITTPSNESPSMDTSDEHSSHMAEDVDVSKTPRSSESQLNAELPEDDPDVSANGVDITSSAPNACGTGYDFRFSSPCHQPSPQASSMPSRYVTPSEFSDVRPTQDEAEVWHALMLGESGLSTPMMFSHQPSRAASVHPDVDAAQPLSIDPSVLQLKAHDPPALGHSNKVSPGRSLRRLGGSLSPLTSLGEISEVDEGRRVPVADGDATPVSDRQRPNVVTPVPNGSISISRGSRDRQSDPSRAPSRSASRALGSSDTGRAVSEAAGVRGFAGGPGASLDELALLARRAPLKICLKVPGRMRGVKRKRDADIDDESEEVTQGRQPGDVAGGQDDEVLNGDTQVGQQDEMSSEVVPSAQTVEGTDQPIPNMSPLGPDSVRGTGEQPGMTSELSASRKATRKVTARRHKKRKRVPKGHPESSVTYHVRNGQIVRVVSAPESRAPATPPASRPEEDDPDMGSPTHVHGRTRKDDGTMKTPPTSRHAKSSPAKEDTWDKVFLRTGTWPELPKVFSHWDTQFIQCDNCDKWYHYGCIAIQPGDPRLEPSALFICPTCHNQSARRLTLRNQDDTCARPDCPEPQITGDSEIFVVEKLVGRKKCGGYVYMWLAKWEGYPMTQSTWIPKENLVGDGTKLLNSFNEEAVEEGADLSQDVVLLQEAIDAGWASLTC